MSTSATLREQVAQLYRTKHDELVRLANHIVRNRDDAEDVVATAYCRMLCNGTQLICDVNGYAARSAWQGAISFRRNARFHERISTQGLFALHPQTTEDTADDVLQALCWQDTATAVTLAVQQLPPPYQHTIKLYYYCGKTCEEIAQRTGVTNGAVKMHLVRGRERLRPVLEDTFYT